MGKKHDNMTTLQFLVFFTKCISATCYLHMWG